MPDIDMDFMQARRGEVIEYVVEKYGRNQVAQIITFGSLLAKGVIRDVARVLDIVDKSGLPYQLTPMGTIIEGETVAEVLAVINEAYTELQKDCGRVYSSIKIDWREGAMGRLGNKVNAVEEKLGRKLNS